MSYYNRFPIRQFNSDVSNRCNFSEKIDGMDHMISGSTVNNPIIRMYSRNIKRIWRKNRMVINIVLWIKDKTLTT